MFGFLRGDHNDHQYRVLYARACQAHFSNNGRLVSPFHSFEAVFLLSIASDLGIVPAPNQDDPTCCRLRHRFAVSETEQEIGRFCAALAMLLVNIKLTDDWHDDKSLTSLLALRIYRRAISSSLQYLQTLDQDFESRIADILNEHAQIEKRGSGLVDLQQFQQPTRRGFGYLFALFAGRWLPGTSQEQFEQIGQCVGSAIIAFDCAVDWKSDQRRKRFNPLHNMNEVHQALLDCARSLIQATWNLRSIAAQDVRDCVSLRILNYQTQSVLARAKSIRQKTTVCESSVEPMTIQSYAALRRGDCDICCAIEACDSCACDALACDSGAAGCFDCLLCCDGFGLCGGRDSAGQRRRDKAGGKPASQKNKQELRSLVGEQGTTTGPLNPTGLVTIKGEVHPASSWAGSFLDANTQVTVVDVDSFGLKVKGKSEF